MWIKASGLRLADVTESWGYVEVDLPALLRLVRDRELASMPKDVAHAQLVARLGSTVIGDKELRPSLETSMHAVLGQVVVHTHSVYVNAFACMEGGEAASKEALRQDAAWALYEAPGYALGVAVDRTSLEYSSARGRGPEAMILRNHGLIAIASSGREAVSVTTNLLRACEAFFGPIALDTMETLPPPQVLAKWGEGLGQALRRRGNPLLVRPASRAALFQAALEPDRWLTAGPLVPDDVVYVGPRVWAVEATLSPEEWLESQTEGAPEKASVVIRGAGVVLAGANELSLRAMEENLTAHVLVRQLIARHGKPRALSPDQVGYLMSMESEKYRQAVAARKAATLGAQ